MRRILIVSGLIGLALVVLIVAAFLLPGESEKSTGRSNYRPPDPTGNATKDPQVKDLILPFETTDIDPQNGVLNPIGVVRFSKDTSDSGHSGIDIPLFKESPVYAAIDGAIIKINKDVDPWGGQGIIQRINTTRPGEGWGFIYEHVTAAPGLKVGDLVKAGDIIAHKTARSGFTAHFQLSYFFNNFEFTRDNKCWLQNLKSSDKQAFDQWWNTYRSSDYLVSSWRTNSEEDKYAFRGLLDPSISPNGLQYCYPAGTDVR